METTFWPELIGGKFCQNFPKEINGFWNDTRTLKKGNCFLTLQAKRDGYDFLKDAQQKEASCALVNRINRELTLPQWEVENVFEAAKILAKRHRKNYTLIAITGSYGKTSTKDMVKLLLGEKAYATAENLNNILGATLTLSHLCGEQFAVIESGIDHPGEMDTLTDLLRPDITLITGISPVHVVNFENFEQLVKEKFKILEDTLSRQGLGIIGENCLEHRFFREVAHRCVLIGRSRQVEVFPNFTRFQISGACEVYLYGKYFKGSVFRVPRMSLGQKEDFAMAATIVKILGLADEVIEERIRDWRPGKMRGERVYFRGHSVYLDSYNANPLAMEDALRHFDEQYSGDNTYVLGGMRELGEFSEGYHRDLVEHFKEKEAGLVIGIGEEMEVFCKILREKHRDIEVIHFPGVSEAKGYFQQRCRGSIFIKGSHDYQLWKIIEE
ncbi:MAG: UDP-N-acetylmuramoyl-tripeptide--D-alanyl-D-alanine ligase [Puniceicoccales bacterium]|nr:UDP-N-acetylmuramoyl-tripeptide--D-alanyl-D-alanine ligase [Puniceicoccales bacterium]